MARPSRGRRVDRLRLRLEQLDLLDPPGRAIVVRDTRGASRISASRTRARRDLHRLAQQNQRGEGLGLGPSCGTVGLPQSSRLHKVLVVARPRWAKKRRGTGAMTKPGRLLVTKRTLAVYSTIISFFI